MNIILDSDVATLLSVAVDATLTRLVKAVHADFRKACGRTFERKERTVYVPGYGPHVDYVFLPEAPIWSLAELRIDATGVLGADTAVDDLTDFAFTGSADEEDFKLLYLGGYFPEGSRVVMARFTAGYHDIESADVAAVKPPEDMRDALIQEAAERWRRGGSEKMQNASAAGVESYTRFREGVCEEFRRAVRRYRRPI
jgi:hypothetical protein